VVNRPGGQVVLFDTPGIHKPTHRMNQRMVDTAVRSVEQVDLVLWLVEAGGPPGPGDRFVGDVMAKARKPVILGINKIDAFPRPRILPTIDAFRRLLTFAEIVPFSALTGENVEVLESCLLRHLPEGDRLYPEDFVTDLPERFFVAEMVREQILNQTRDEIPYVTGVVVESFKEDPEIVRIEATIYVERDSQKAIVIGKGGERLKRIGTAARGQIEAFLGTHVYLGLFVKVRDRWRENSAILKEMGLEGGRE
jgi:GTP-binding protein Era